MSTAPATAKCRGTRWCPKGAATRCTRCGRDLCGRCWTYTTCGPKGHREAERNLRAAIGNE